MQDAKVQSANVYTDFKGLNALKSQAHGDKQGALHEVAKQFESLFTAQMMKSMRKVNDVFSEGNYLESKQTKFYQGMFDNQLALSMSQGKGLGLSAVLERQLSKQIPGLDQSGEATAAHHQSITDYNRSLPAVSPALPEQVEKVDQLMTSVPATAAPNQSKLPDHFESPQQFVNAMMPAARKAAGDSGIDPRIMVAQAALETGWGKHMIAGDGGKASHNLFGIKADSRWPGDSVTIKTTEYREGIPMKEQAAFRAYDDYTASMADYVDFLKQNPRYRDVLAAADKPDVFAQKLQDAGYATDPAYANKIQRIMNSAPFEGALDNTLSLNGSAEHSRGEE